MGSGPMLHTEFRLEIQRFEKAMFREANKQVFIFDFSNTYLFKTLNIIKIHEQILHTSQNSCVQLSRTIFSILDFADDNVIIVRLMNFITRFNALNFNYRYKYDFISIFSGRTNNSAIVKPVPVVY